MITAVLVLVGIIAGSTGRHTRHRARRRTRHANPQRVTVVGVLVLGAILGATVAGGALVHAVVRAVSLLASSVLGWLG